MHFFINNNIFKYLFFLLLTVIISCKPTERFTNNISCGGKLIIQYDGINYKRNTKPTITKDSKIITVIFLSEYKDSIRGYVDNKLTYNEFVDQRDYNDSNNYNFSKPYPKNSTPKIKIESTTQKTCFDIEVDKRYSFVYVWLLEKEKWQIRFSNSYYLP